MCRSKIDFCLLILYHSNLMRSLSSVVSWVGSLGFSVGGIMSSRINGSFTFSCPSWMPLFSVQLSCVEPPARCWVEVESGYILVLLLILEEKYPVFHCEVYLLCFFVDGLYQIEEVPSVPSFLKSWLGFNLHFLRIHWDNHFFFLLYFIAIAELSMYFWCKIDAFLVGLPVLSRLSLDLCQEPGERRPLRPLPGGPQEPGAVLGPLRHRGGEGGQARLQEDQGDQVHSAAAACSARSCPALPAGALTLVTLWCHSHQAPPPQGSASGMALQCRPTPPRRLASPGTPSSEAVLLEIMLEKLTSAPR